MKYTATAKNIKISPRKMRLVVDSVKKQAVPVALMSLGGMSNRAAVPIKKALESAMANAVNNFKAEKTNLSITEILIGEGITYKRFHYAGRGRTRPYKKRTSHVTVVLEDKTVVPEVKLQAKEEAVAVDAPKKGKK
jgi:large subunit ribosomal protein L22